MVTQRRDQHQARDPTPLWKRLATAWRVIRGQYTMADFDRDLKAALRGGRTYAGVHVNEDSALRFATVYACARVLAETVGSLPLFVYRERPDGGREKAKDHPLYWLLHDEPNSEMDSLTLRETMTGQMALSGNAYAILTRNRRGEVMEIYPWPWHQVQPDRDPDTRELFYWVYDRGKRERLPAERVLHVHLWGPDGVIGYSPIRYAREVVGLGLAATEFAGRFFGQGMNFGLVVEHPGVLSETARRNLREDLIEQGAGMHNAWLPIVLEEGAKLNRIPMPLEDAQFVQLVRLTQEQICSIFRVPPHMVANLDRATYSNIEHMSIGFVVYTILPWVTRWEQAINRRLFTRQEREQGYYVKFNLSGLLRGDAKSRAEALHIMRQDGIISADEWRELEEMNPQPGGVGKTYYINGNMVPLGSNQAASSTTEGGENQ